MDRIHRKWPKIHNWYNMIRNIKLDRRDEFRLPTLTYRVKPKLHGTNASVTIFPDGSIMPQSRSRILPPGRDNYGFAAYVRANEHHFQKLADMTDDNRVITLFGEWVGPGIQKGVAISKIPRRTWCLFAAKYEDDDRTEYYCEPQTLWLLIRNIPDTTVLPWHVIDDQTAWKVDLNDVTAVNKFLDTLETEVARIDRHDPYVAETWGIDGCGEGLVAYPVRADGTFRPDAMFKVKGPSHQTTVRKPMRSPQKKQRAMILAEQICTPARIEQGFQEVCQTDGFDTPVRHPLQHMKVLMPWLAADIQAECATEIHENELEWRRDLARPCGTLASQWLLKKSKT